MTLLGDIWHVITCQISPNSVKARKEDEETTGDKSCLQNGSDKMHRANWSGQQPFSVATVHTNHDLGDEAYINYQEVNISTTFENATL